MFPNLSLVTESLPVLRVLITSRLANMKADVQVLELLLSAWIFRRLKVEIYRAFLPQRPYLVGWGHQSLHVILPIRNCSSFSLVTTIVTLMGVFRSLFFGILPNVFTGKAVIWTHALRPLISAIFLQLIISPLISTIFFSQKVESLFVVWLYSQSEYVARQRLIN